jgi:hypothetical protein
MKATFEKPTKEVFDPKVRGKQLIGGWIAIDCKNKKEVITVRYYESSKRSSCLYCAVWVSLQNDFTLATAKTSGCGYDMFSEALERALNNAGIVLSERIGGMGTQVEKDALDAIMTYLGHTDYMIVRINK